MPRNLDSQNMISLHLDYAHNSLYNGVGNDIRSQYIEYYTFTKLFHSIARYHLVILHVDICVFHYKSSFPMEYSFSVCYQFFVIISVLVV